MTNGVITVEFILYLAFILGIGLYFARKKMTQEGFLLGAKKIPGWALALSERATGESAWLVLGLTGFAFTAGLSSVWIAVGCVSGITVSWLWLADKFRKERDIYNALTLPDYFAAKYKDKAQFIRLFSSIIIIFFFVLYVAAQFNGAGKTLNVTFGMSKTTGVIISAIIVIAYSMAGGFFSVVWTDVIQGILMIITLVVTPIIGLFYLSAHDISIINALSTAGAGLGMDKWTGTATGFAAGILIFSNFAWFFGYLGGQPQLDARWMAMKSKKDVKTGKIVAITWTIFAYIGAILIGLEAFAILGNTADAEQVLPLMLMKLFPPAIAGILLAGAVAAMMSTADSQILVATSSVSEDIIHKAMKKNISNKKMVVISRITVLFVGLFAFILALVFTSDKSLIYTIVHWAWAGIGCSFAPAVILSFFWKKFSSSGVVASLVTGFLVTVIWKISGLDKVLTARAASFIMAFIMAVIFTLIFPKKAKIME